MSDFYRRHNPNILNKNYLNKNNFYSNINSNVNREYLAKDLTEDLEIKAKAEAFDKLFDLLKDKVRRRPHYNNLEAFLAKDSDYETYYFKSFTSEEVLNILKVMKEVNPNFKYNLDGNQNIGTNIYNEDEYGTDNKIDNYWYSLNWDRHLH